MSRPGLKRAAGALALAALGALVWFGPTLSVPDRLRPWDFRVPLALDDPPNALTRWRLWRLEQDPSACFAAIAGAGLAVARVTDQPEADGCSITDALRLPSRLALRPGAPVLTCGMAASWVLFERHALQPAAREHLGSEVVGVRHLGSYNCRNVRGGERRSQHASANALDVAGFTLRDGREVTLLRGWDRPGGEGDFLRAARDGACRFFGAVLGPERDALHRDHFHLDRGMWRRCQ